jgi:hypothetical protein
MKHAHLLFVFACISTLFYSCDKCKDTDCFSPPQTLMLQVLEKETGADLIANGTFSADEITIRLQDSALDHDITIEEIDGMSLITDLEIGWETGTGQVNYVLILSEDTQISFIYETQEVSRDCCTFFETTNIDFPDQEFNPLQQAGIYQIML